MDHSNHLYFDLGKRERDAVVGYLLTSLLQARKTCQLPSNENYYDEDVNIYLAHLLLASCLPDYQALTKRYLTLNTSELFQTIEQNDDRVVRYFIYKVNADYLLVHLGIFNDLPSARQHAFHKSERQYTEIAQSYYEQASQYNQLIYRKHTAIGDVLDKLAHHIDDYKRILGSIRDDFFNLNKKIVVPENQKSETPDLFEKVIHSLELEQKQNEFLDLYSKWLESRSLDIAGKLETLAAEIKKIDPSFNFDVNSIRDKKEGV